MTHLIFRRAGMKPEAKREKRAGRRKIIRRSHTARKNSVRHYQHHCERWSLEIKRHRICQLFFLIIFYIY
jgi:hypothetical protein